MKKMRGRFLRNIVQALLLVIIARLPSLETLFYILTSILLAIRINRKIGKMFRCLYILI